MGNSEPTVRPTLIVDNAVDFQSDPMTYHYQVFDDAELTNIVAEVPVIAGGIGTTSWTVDVDLLPDTQYWWRCRATDDSAHTGPWMETATFFVQLTDHPPTVPVLLGPSRRRRAGRPLGTADLARVHRPRRGQRRLRRRLPRPGGRRPGLRLDRDRRTVGDHDHQGHRRHQRHIWPNSPVPKT